MKIARDQHLDKDPRLSTEGDFYFGKLMAFAEAKVCFYMCSRCSKPYFGGLIDCEQEMGMEDTTRREDLICRTCLLKEMSVGSNACKIHGAEFIDWKCMFCCSIATFSCGGALWFCTPCHDDRGRKDKPDCKGNFAKCPLKMQHPPHGDNPRKNAFPLGCSLCRMEHLKQFDEAQAAIAGMGEEDMLKFMQIDRSLHESFIPIGGFGPTQTKVLIIDTLTSGMSYKSQIRNGRHD